MINPPVGYTYFYVATVSTLIYSYLGYGILLQVDKSAFCQGFCLPWNFYFYHLHSATLFIFSFDIFSSIFHSGLLGFQCALLAHEIFWFSHNPVSNPNMLAPLYWGGLFLPLFIDALTKTQTYRLPDGVTHQS